VVRRITRALIAALVVLAAWAPGANASALPTVALSVARAIPNEPRVAGRMTIRDGKGVDYLDPRFQRALAARWRELRRRGLAGHLQRSVRGHADRLASSGAAGRNFRRWPVLGRRVWPNPAAVRRTTYASEVRALRTWLRRRVAWLDRNVGRLRSS
jgi:hypothetical protein